MLVVVGVGLGKPPPPCSSRCLGGLNLLLALREGRPGFPMCGTGVGGGGVRLEHRQQPDPRKMGLYIQWNTTQPYTRMKICHLQQHGWTWRASC